MSVFKVAVVGAGSMAHEHIRAFSSIDEVSIVGITSRTRSRAEDVASEFSISIVADNISDLYKETKADLVIITVPELQANAVAKECFTYDWAVFMEKPAGYDLNDAEDIAEAAKGRSKPVMVGLNRRYYSSLIAVKEDLDTREDESRFIHVQDQQSYEEARFYKHPEEVVEKFMYANSIHMIDIIMALGRGEVSKVTPITPWLGEKTEVMLAYVEFDSGDTALYEGLWKGPGPWSGSVSTNSRRWTMRPLEDASFQNANERTQNSVERSGVDKEYKPGFVLQAQAAVNRAKGLQSDIADLDESMRTMLLINKMFGV